MKSVPGNNSSTISNIPPTAPLQPPNVRKKTKPEMGAQMRSASSPKTGKPYVAKPSRSITMQNAKEGCRLIMN